MKNTQYVSGVKSLDQMTVASSLLGVCTYILWEVDAAQRRRCTI